MVRTDKQRAYDRAYRKKHRAHLNKLSNEWSKKNPEKRLAIQRKYHRSHELQVGRWRRQWGLANKAKLLAQDRVRKAKRRQAVLAKYGRKCKRCGFSDWRALQVDHIHGKGTADLRRFNNSHYAFYNFLLEKKRKGYRILCANCNWIMKYRKKQHGSGPPLRGSKYD